jgi:hypothetical protein
MSLIGTLGRYAPSLMLLGLGLTNVQAQALRDPTIPPAAAGMSEGGKAAKNSTEEGLKGPISVLVVDGRPNVVVATRLYAVGQKLGTARIERITETEVWLREGRDLRKVSIFQGIQRRTVGSATADGSKP